MQDIFSGIRILDLTKVFSGPFCSRLFADYGAEVIKIESPQSPDDSRHFPPLSNGRSGYFSMLNRNKQGITLDLKAPEGRKKFLSLAETADVIVENLTPHVKTSLGIDYDAVKKINPTIIYASLSGTGQQDSRRYYDILAQAESGLMLLSGTGGVPMKIGPSVVDAFSGLMLAFGISGALLFRQKTGKGQSLDVSMLGAAMHLLESNLTETSVTGANPIQMGNQDSMIAPFGIYKAKDGYIALAAGNDAQWSRLEGCLSGDDPVDRTQFSTNQMRVEHNGELTGWIERSFADHTVDSLMALLATHGVACSKVQSMRDVLGNDALFASGELLRMEDGQLGKHTVPGRAIRFSAAPNHETRNAPAVGEHNSTYDI
jgi:CoA:oxalate CoA-transferase